MPVRRVSSRDNRWLKRMRAAAAGRASTALIEGPKLLAEALDAGASVLAVAVAESALDKWPRLLERCRQGGIDAFCTTEALLAGATDVVTSQGLVALAELKLRELDSLGADSGPLILAADGIGDPGNLGAMMRSALAFGARALVLLPGCAGPANSKVVRSSAGAVFRLALAACPTAEFFGWLAGRRITALGLDAHATTELSSCRLSEACAIIVGSESAGLSEQTRQSADRLARIPIDSSCDSLNAAVAASVALYEAARQRRGGLDA